MQPGTYTVTLRLTKDNTLPGASEMRRTVAATTMDIQVAESTATPFAMSIERAQ